MTFSPTLYRDGVVQAALIVEAELSDQIDLLREAMASPQAADDGFVAGLLDGLTV